MTGLISGIVLPNYNISGGLISILSDTSLEVSPVQVRDNTNSNDILIESAITVRTDINGINALDTGTIAASTVYYVHALSSSLGRAPSGYILSKNLVIPYLPTNYDTYVRIGIVVTDSSSHLVPILMTGLYSEKKYQYLSPQTVLPSGVATAWTNINLGAVVPGFPTRVNLGYTFQPNAAGDVANLTAPSSSNAPVIVIKGNVAGVSLSGALTSLCSMATISSNLRPSIAYQVSTGTDLLILSVIGFDDFV